MRIRPESCADFYKIPHIYQYPKGTNKVSSNLTARSCNYAPGIPGIFDNQAVLFGPQGFIKEFLIEEWNKNFFEQPLEKVIARYKRRMDTSLGPNLVGTEHIEALHKLGYLPIMIKALPEGSKVNIKVPFLTITNTKDEFFWLVNFLETAMSANLWKQITNATTAYKYRLLIDQYTRETGAFEAFAPWQGHDFSMRGMSGVEDAARSGGGHLLSFLGTDTIPAIDYLEDYYGAENTFVGGSVRATEHSVMCMGGKDDEIGTFRRLINDNPSGILSIVSDTWNFWIVITNTARILKPEIMARKPDAMGFAKTVFRPDSGDPVKIIVGDPDAPMDSPECKGAVECLWEIFGGDTNSLGYRTLNQRVGLIYGDSITLPRAKAIFEGLKAKGFGSGNVVLGIGSYTYQFVTRDAYGMAIKATYGEVNGVGRELFKDPITDNGTKKSAKGLIQVFMGPNGYEFKDQCTADEELGGALRVVFQDGHLFNEESLDTIRARLAAK